MAGYVGKAGKVNFSSSDLPGGTNYVTDWGLDTSVDVAVVRLMGTSWVKRYPGFLDWTATVECEWPDATDPSSLLGTDASLKLYIDANNYFEGNALCIGYGPVMTIDGIARCTFTFEGNDSAGLTFN